tara:strand:+ start:8179 stop:8532 length:354 start_codon:yes stop_codon:yes gene_type:complete
MKMSKFTELFNAIMAEARKSYPQMEYIDKLNEKSLGVAILKGINRYFSNTIPFPSRDLLQREVSASEEIAFHVVRKNKHQAFLEIQDLQDMFLWELLNNSENQTIEEDEEEEDELPF